MEQYAVFISYKHTDEQGQTTEDCRIADGLYEALKKKGISVFMSGQSIFQLGISDYKKAIDAALESARLLIVVASSVEYIRSGWVEYEYETFCEDILSKRKPYGSILSYTNGILQDELPRTLSRFQNYFTSEVVPDKLAEFVRLLLEKSEQDPASASWSHQNIEEEHKETGFRPARKTGGTVFAASNYSSDYSNELRRLEIQSQNAARTDRVALDWLCAQKLWPEDEKLCVLDLGSAYGFVAADRFGNDPRVEKVLCVDFNARVIERARILFAENPKMIFEVIDVESDSFESDLRALMEKHGIGKFHIVFSALLLLHLRDPNRVLRKVRRLTEPGAAIIVRGSDDGSKLCYPHAELMDEIIRRCAELPEASDRYNGRKLFAQLSNSGFRNVRMFSTMTDLSEFDFDGRTALFAESFAYRADAFRRRAEAAPNDSLRKSEYQWICNALEEFENQFYESNFWYCEYDYIAVGFR